MPHENVQSFTHPVAPGCEPVEVSAGDTVRDDLAKVVEIWKEGTDSFTLIGVKLDSDYLDGLRHPWEITPATAS